MKTREFEGKSIADIIAKIEAEGEVFSFAAFKRSDGVWRVVAEWFEVVPLH
jgi:hypothetical protein